MVTGANGMLGADAVALLDGLGEQVSAHTRETLDLDDPDAVEAAVAGHDVVWNCAAWTAVDAAETEEPEALRVNGVLPGVLAAASARAGARMVQVSTDYVFSGEARTPYGEDATPDPRSAYGRTKAVGERAVRVGLPDAHLIVRTAWLYGAHGGCFPKTILRLARERGTVSVVEDQTGQPTWTRDVADLVVRLVRAEAPAGTYHATSGGQTSWFGFAQRVVAAGGLDPSVVTPTDSAAFAQAAPRPAYSVLGHGALQALGIVPIAEWDRRWDEASAEVLAAV